MLDKKLATSSKYEKVKSKVNTGKTVKHVETVSDQLVAKRRGENFHRIKPSTLIKFLTEVASTESVFDLLKQEDKENLDAKSTVESCLTHETCASAVTYTTEMLGPDAQILLLDLREAADYARAHIKESLNFPAPGITQDAQIAKLLRVKGDREKKVVVYHWDERKGAFYAKLLFEKGFDNVFLLTGGFAEFIQKHTQEVDGRDVETVRIESRLIEA